MTKPTLDDLIYAKPRRTLPPPPHASLRERLGVVLSLLLAAGVIALLAATSGCEFVAEGEGLVGDPDHHRPQRPGGQLLPGDDPSDPSTTDDPDGSSSEGGEAEVDASSSEDGSTSVAGEADASSSSDAGESTTGELDPYEPAHCDMTCPEGDALEPSPEQAGGTWPGCYCATPCASDDDCAPLEHCEPLFDRCTIACMGDDDCMGIDPVPGAMACTLWWESAESLTHFCSYWNEDAP